MRLIKLVLAQATGRGETDDRLSSGNSSEKLMSKKFEDSCIRLFSKHKQGRRQRQRRMRPTSALLDREGGSEESCLIKRSSPLQVATQLVGDGSVS